MVSGSSSLARAHGRGGFTLIEILVVLAIVCVLVAMLLPTLSRARESARRVMCGNNARSLNLATLMYSDDYGGNVPDNLTQANAGRYRFSPDNRRELYLNYGMNRWEAWFCPSGVARGVNVSIPKTVERTRGGFYTRPDITYNGVEWTENNRAFTGYGYWVGAARGYALGTASARAYTYDRIDKLADTHFPARRVVWGEVIKPNGSLNGGGGVWTAPANGHTRDGGRECEGGWFAMVDQSVVWRRVEFGFNTLEKSFQYFAYKDLE